VQERGEGGERERKKKRGSGLIVSTKKAGKQERNLRLGERGKRDMRKR
jgi:hypothetical protein